MFDTDKSFVPPAAAAAHAAWVKEQKEVAVLMLLTMDLDIQWNLAHLVREFHTCKQEEGQLVSSYVLKMKGYIDNLERLGQPVGQNLAVSLILVSLNKDFDSFVQNYNMHGMGKTVNELHATLKLHEDTLPKKDANPALHAKQEGFRKTKKINRTKLLRGVKVIAKVGELHQISAICLLKPKTHPPPKKDNPAKDIGLRGSKKLKLGALSLYVGDGHRAAVEAIRTYHLELPSGLVIVLNNCHYAPSITRGVISVSRLFDDGFINRFDENNVISFDVLLFAIKSKTNFDSSLLWHCRIGHISKKRIEKLQHDGLLNSIDVESLGKCVSCLSGKIERKPYSHQVERAKDLLGLIHTDVFQKEVENQLGKTIKSLCSDRGGEYMS
ncbi:retrotransposon protein, putative, ty1-copia subclass [Tanacetum coccineum]